MEKKLKTYVLMISRVFPAYHPRKGEETYFMSKILLNSDQVVVQDGEDQFASKPGYGSKYAAAMVKEMGFDPKIHTIRENYDLWARRAEKINKGEAILSLRQWTGSPYNYKRDGSKQVEFMCLEKIGVQRVKISRLAIDGRHIVVHTSVEGKLIDIDKVAKNDGLSFDDFCKWFKEDVDGVCIHFTDFKY